MHCNRLIDGGPCKIRTCDQLVKSQRKPYSRSPACIRNHDTSIRYHAKRCTQARTFSIALSQDCPTDCRTSARRFTVQRGYRERAPGARTPTLGVNRPPVTDPGTDPDHLFFMGFGGRRRGCACAASTPTRHPAGSRPEFPRLLPGARRRADPSFSDHPASPPRGCWF